MKKLIVFMTVAALLCGCTAEKEESSSEPQIMTAPTETTSAAETVTTTAISTTTMEMTVTTQPVTEEPKDEDLVRIIDFIPDIFIDLRYATSNNFTGKVIYNNKDAYLCYGTVKKLAMVQEELRKMDYSIVVWDAYRPYEAQKKLWEVYPDPNYVADPRNGITSHSKGNTVDIGILTSKGGEVELPSEFDEFSALADRNYSDVTVKAAENSQMLEDLMTKYGFKGYQGEWWHYSDTTEYGIQGEEIPLTTAAAATVTEAAEESAYEEENDDDAETENKPLKMTAPSKTTVRTMKTFTAASSDASVTESGQTEKVTEHVPDDNELVLIRDYIPDINIDLRYATVNNFTGKVIYTSKEAYLCYGAVKKLAKVQEELKKRGYSLLIWDAYRPPEAQQKLWEVYPDPNFVADPRNGLTSHSKGGTVDISILTADGKEVEMPSAFDEFSAAADRDYSDVSALAAANAKMLEDIMFSNGFKGYSGEWWDYTDLDGYIISNSVG